MAVEAFRNGLFLSAFYRGENSWSENRRWTDGWMEKGFVTIIVIVFFSHCRS